MIEIKRRSLIETKPLEYDFGTNEDKKNRLEAAGQTVKDISDEDADYQTGEVGKYPLVYIDGVQVENENIKYLKIFNDAMYPSIEIEFSDPTSHLIDENYPLDDSIVSVYKKSTSKGFMDIKMDFKIMDFKTIKGTSANTISLKLTGILNIDDLFLCKFESYKDTSYNVLDNMTNLMKLGFASNITDTNDSMTWINPAYFKHEFIRDIVNHSYLDDTTFLFGYIDFYYNFNYVDIEKQINSDISTQMTINDTESVLKDDKEEPIPLILSNNEDKADTTLYIEKYTVINKSTEINVEYGYRYRFTSYNISEDKINKYLLDSISESGPNGIILKGNPDNNTLYNESIRGHWMGKLDNDNVHKNYLHSSLQNTNNLKFLQKLKISIKMKKPNYGLYRFQKVLVELYNFGKPDNEEEVYGKRPENIEDEGQYDNKIINKLSGEWLITAINFTFSTKEGNVQELTLVKRELTDVYNFPRRESKNKK